VMLAREDVGGCHTEFSLSKSVVLEQVNHGAASVSSTKQTYLALALFFVCF
jgi:hypothetical protein